MVCFFLLWVHLCSSVRLPSLRGLCSAHNAASITSRTFGGTNCHCVSTLLCGGKTVVNKTYLRSKVSEKHFFWLLWTLLDGFDGSFWNDGGCLWGAELPNQQVGYNVALSFLCCQKKCKIYVHWVFTLNLFSSFPITVVKFLERDNEFSLWTTSSPLHAAQSRYIFKYCSTLIYTVSLLCNICIYCHQHPKLTTSCSSAWQCHINI